MNHAQVRMQELVSYLNRAAYAYYVMDDPIISDMQYDKLYDELKALETETKTVLPDSPTIRVGDATLKEFEQHRHISPLWSMDKVQSLEELDTWVLRTEKLAEQKNLQYYIEYKFDGLTLNLTYEGVTSPISPCPTMLRSTLTPLSMRSTRKSMHRKRPGRSKCLGCAETISMWPESLPLS